MFKVKSLFVKMFVPTMCVFDVEVAENIVELFGEAAWHLYKDDLEQDN